MSTTGQDLPEIPPEFAPTLRVIEAMVGHLSAALASQPPPEPQRQRLRLVHSVR